jgi:hypothetical protein
MGALTTATPMEVTFSTAMLLDFLTPSSLLALLFAATAPFFLESVRLTTILMSTVLHALGPSSTSYLRERDDGE